MSDALTNRLWQELLEKDDRTSPAEHPDMCLITKAELSDFLAQAVFKWGEERRHGIEVQDLRDLDGAQMGYWTKGHYPLHDFVDAVNHYTGAEPGHDDRHVSHIKQCRHGWWRTTPVSGEPGMVQYLPAEPRSRGAFPVTVTTVIEDKSIRETQRHIDQYHRAEARGFADGVNWALRQINDINQDVGKDVLAFYRQMNKREIGHG
jgi:hypothetical protein